MHGSSNRPPNWLELAQEAVIHLETISDMLGNIDTSLADIRSYIDEKNLAISATNKGDI